MFVDWFTVIAQIVNFLVLVALMQHFFYKRLVNAIDTREKRIENQMAEADQKNQQAARDMERARLDAEQIEQQRDQMLRDARQQADREHDELYQKSLASVKALEIKWRQELDREKAIFFEQIRARATAEILAVARHSLNDLASADLQQCVVGAFLHSLHSLNGGSWRGDLVVRSASELPPETRSRIEDALRLRAGEDAQIRFERAPQMAWGLELSTNGTRIGWNPENYIGELEENLRRAFEQRTT
jgi:F-type H+-transporting ATPase subunit b